MASNGSNITTTYEPIDTDYYNRDKLLQPYIVVYLSVTGITSIIGVIGNLMTMATFCATKALHQTRNAFIVNLAVADLLVTGIVMPFSIYGVLAGKTYFDRRHTLCSFLATVCAPGCLASMYTICWIGCTRYFYICKFPIYNQIFSEKRTALFIASIWATGFVVHFPNHVGWGSSRYSIGFQLCTLDLENFAYSFFYGCFQVSAIGITFVFYLKIFLTVRKSRASIRMVAGGGAAKNDQQHVQHFSETQFRNEIKLAKTSFKIFIIFVCTWTPTALLILIGRNDFPSPVYLYSVYMAHANSALNFFIYYVDNEMFKKGFKISIRKMLGQKHHNVISVATNNDVGAVSSKIRKSSIVGNPLAIKNINSNNNVNQNITGNDTLIAVSVEPLPSTEDPLNKIQAKTSVQSQQLFKIV